MKPKLLSVSAVTMEWCTRCMSEVTTIQRSACSSQAGIRMFPWLNSVIAVDANSNVITASSGGPSSKTVANLTIAASTIWTG